MSTPKLHELAVACHNGACNPRAILVDLGKRIVEDSVASIHDNLDIKYIIGQVSFLLGESLGPTEKTVREFMEREEKEAAGVKS